MNLKCTFWYLNEIHPNSLKLKLKSNNNMPKLIFISVKNAIKMIHSVYHQVCYLFML